MSCVGCVSYVVDPENKVITMFYCEKYAIRDKFPGAGCQDFVAKEPRYEKYDHKAYCASRGIPES